MKRIFTGVIDLLLEKEPNFFSFILKEKRFEKYFEEIKNFVKVNVERKVAFQINAIKISTLTDLLKSEKELSYSMCESLFVDVVEQIKLLENMGYGFLSIHPDDIIFVESDKNNFSFIFLNLQDYYTVKNNSLEIDKPYSKHKYFSPNIKTITEIPTIINYQQNIFYSLAMIVCNCLNKIDSKYNYSDYKNHLDCILETKLYWALLRCLKDNSNERYCLFI